MPEDSISSLDFISKEKFLELVKRNRVAELAKYEFDKSYLDIQEPDQFTNYPPYSIEGRGIIDIVIDSHSYPMMDLLLRKTVMGNWLLDIKTEPYLNEIKKIMQPEHKKHDHHLPDVNAYEKSKDILRVLVAAVRDLGDKNELIIDYSKQNSKLEDENCKLRAENEKLRSKNPVKADISYSKNAGLLFSAKAISSEDKSNKNDTNVVDEKISNLCP